MIRARAAASHYFNNFFFHSPSFVLANNPATTISFNVEEDGAEIARIFFSKTDGRITSLHRSPFGGFDISERATAHSIQKLIGDFEGWCRNNNVKEIFIRSFPDAYDPIKSRLIHTVLLANHYDVSMREQLQFIWIDENSLKRFNRNRNRKLKECIAAGFQFVQLGIDHLEDAYEIFVECRSKKNYPITMSLADFKDAFEKFPDKYFLFGVIDRGSLIAASVCVVVNNRILYDFFHGDRLSGRKFSPLSLLVKGLVEFCLDRKVELLDLGVSTDRNGINKGLQQFKASFGARTDQKLTYHKRILSS
jgi:hypothetical protein